MFGVKWHQLYRRFHLAALQSSIPASHAREMKGTIADALGDDSYAKATVAEWIRSPLPCFACGSDPVTQYTSKSTGEVQIGCHECGARGPKQTTTNRARIAWNLLRRNNPPLSPKTKSPQSQTSQKAV